MLAPPASAWASTDTCAGTTTKAAGVLAARTSSARARSARLAAWRAGRCSSAVLLDSANTMARFSFRSDFMSAVSTAVLNTLSSGATVEVVPSLMVPARTPPNGRSSLQRTCA